MVIEINIGDIVVAIHDEGMRHPFLVIEINNKGFVALKATSVKYNKNAKEIIITKYIKKL